MAKITKVTILDETTLRLDTDASAGDEIDLLALNQINQKVLIKKIEEGKDAIYLKKLEEVKQLLELKQKNEIASLEASLKEEYKQKEQKYLIKINEVETSAKNLQSSIDEKVKLASMEEVQKLQAEIIELKNQVQTFKINEELNIVKQDAKYNELLKEKENLEKDFDSKIEIAILKKNQEYTELLNEKEQEIIRLKHDRTSLNIKRIGEDLERWCDNEYASFALAGFKTCTWQKDNISVKLEGEEKGTKGDFIFRVFATEEHNPDEELVSVLCEMKSEDPLSVNKKTNASHFPKLDKDRTKKNCEYALLVSELELEQSNDIPIRKVLEYPNMYVVRPRYFIPFLSLIEALGKKYQDIMLADKKEAAMFEKTEVILEKFNSFKEELLEKLLVKIENEVSVINKQVKAIDEASDKIKDSTHNIIEKHLVNIKKKIEKFDITKINKLIDKLDD